MTVLVNTAISEFQFLSSNIYQEKYKICYTTLVFKSQLFFMK